MIVIWGANGFIGRHLTHRLLHAGRDITLLARNFDQMPFALPSNAQTFTADFSDTSSYIEILRGCRVLILLVSASSSRTFEGQEHEEFERNVKPYQNLFDAMESAGIKPERILYLSSGGAIYGQTPAAAVSEDYPINPITTYGKAKAEIERATIDFCSKTGIGYTLLRVANPVGPWFKKMSLIPAALHAAKTDSVLNVLGDGSTVRDYFDVTELADAIVRVLDTNDTLNTILNVGSGKGQSINQIISMVEEIAGKKIRLRHVEDVGPVISHNVLDCDLIRRYTNWATQKPIKKTIFEMWNSK